MIENFDDKSNMLDSLDPRAGKFEVFQFIKQDGVNSKVDLNLEPCD